MRFARTPFLPAVQLRQNSMRYIGLYLGCALLLCLVSFPNSASSPNDPNFRDNQQRLRRVDSLSLESRNRSNLSAKLNSSISSDNPAWVGKGKYRLLVRIDPLDLESRKSDEMPAEIDLTSEQLHQAVGGDGKIDAASFQVGRYNFSTGKPVNYGKWAYAQTDWEVPYRWYDSSIPEPFPEFMGIINADGQLHYTDHPGWGYLHETLGEWDQGRLAWIHTQEANQPSYYAIYFDFLPAKQEPSTVDRRGFLGDGNERVTDIGPTTTGLRIGRVDTVDWNDDGLTDLLLGFQRGGMVWFPNRGTKEQPSYPYPKLIFTSDGKPIDAGEQAAPLVIDWDGDGLFDVLCGTNMSRVLWYKNIGTKQNPSLKYMGLLMVDGHPLTLPNKPVPESERIYDLDYHPMLAAADWDDDGDIDLLAGGYATGRIYWFSNEGRDKDNLPILKFQGTIDADGQPIDTEWAAAPLVADFDNDGDLDLISGSMAMHTDKDAKPGHELLHMWPDNWGPQSKVDYLYYFENIGDRKHPKLTRRDFPIKGKFHLGHISSPRAADLNGDGLLDLVISEGANIYIYYNIGTATAPLWEYTNKPLEGRWNSAYLGWAIQILPGAKADWNNDGLFDLVVGFSIRLNEGKGNPQLFGPLQSVLPKGEVIFHKSPYGDQWTFTHACDLDSDGKVDYLYGVHEGNIYFHRNLTRGRKKHFDLDGVLLKTRDGQPIKVGLHPVTWDFNVLQGSRVAPTCGDFDRDGKVDLVVADTYGKLRYYRNLSGGTNPVFALPELVGDLTTRTVPTTSDWNGDGWPDIIYSIGGEAYFLPNSGKAGPSRFGPAQKLNVPPLPYETTVMVVDWNGDGDDDIVSSDSYGYFCWADASFMKHGYAKAKLEKMEKR